MSVRKVLAVFAGTILMLGMFAGTAAAHQVTKVAGTVDCQGNYSILAHGDVYNPVTLTIKLGGTIVYGPALQGTDTSMRDLPFSGPVTGTGATVGESIEASTSDGSQTSGKLVLTGGPCTPPPTPPGPPVVTCGGTASFTDVTEGLTLIIEPGDILVTSGFDSIALAPGAYTYQWRDANGNDITADGGSGKFTIDVCLKPVVVVTTPSCGTLDVNLNADAVTAGYSIEVEVKGSGIFSAPWTGLVAGDNIFDKMPAGDYMYYIVDGKGVPVGDEGSFTIGVCATPTPVVTPTPKPSPTPPVTSSDPGSSPTGNDPLGMILFGSAAGLLAIGYIKRHEIVGFFAR